MDKWTNSFIIGWVIIKNCMPIHLLPPVQPACGGAPAPCVDQRTRLLLLLLLPSPAVAVPDSPVAVAPPAGSEVGAEAGAPPHRAPTDDGEGAGDGNIKRVKKS